MNETKGKYDTEALKTAYTEAADALKTALEEDLKKTEESQTPDAGGDSGEGKDPEENSTETKTADSAETRSGYQILDLEAYLDSLLTIPESCQDEKKAYDEAKSEYEQAQKAISDAQSSYEQAKQNSVAACEAYEQAQSQKESVQEQHDATVEQAQETYEKAKLEDQLVKEDDARNQIEQYEEQLEDCTVYASMTGTITALNVEAGGVFTGG